MKLDPSFVHHRKITRELECGKLFAGRAGSSRRRDVNVAATLLALLVVAIATPAPVSFEVGDSGGARQSYVAFMIDVLTTLVLSIGPTWLLFSSRHRAEDDGTRS